jgi:hypothetical protein
MSILEKIAFCAFGLAGFVTLILRTEIRAVLRFRNRPESYSGCLGGLYGLPFKDLAELRDLIEAEPDSTAAPQYRRLARSYRVAMIAAASLFVLAWIVFAVRAYAA